MSFLSRVHPLDLTVILLFLAVNMIVGFWSRGGSQTFTEYAIGDKKFSTPVLTATIVATWMSGSTFFIVLGNSYTQGLYYIIAKVVGGTLCLLITGLVLGKRMGKFLNHISVPHILGSLYGPTVQAISGVSAVLPKVAYLAVQFNIIAKITGVLFGYTGPEITIITATLVILYSTSGGVKSVTFTDVVQFTTFSALLPLLALAVWNRMEAAPLQVATVFNSNPNFSFREVIGSPAFTGTLALMAYSIIPNLPPQLFQRILMARNVKQIQQSFIWATLICLAVSLCMIWTALLLLAEKPDLQKAQVVPYLVQTYAYPGLKGLVGVGVIALAMSTIDSVLNSCAVIIAHDIVPRLGSRYKASVNVARVATLVLGFTALLLALQLQDLLKTILYAASFYVPIVAVPMLLTIFGFKTSRRVVLMAMGAGAVTVVSFLLYYRSANSFLPGMLANLAVMLGAHYGLGEKGGWGHNPVSDIVSEPEDHTNSWQYWMDFFRQLRPTAYLERLLPRQEVLYPILGFYILTVTYASLYFLSPAVQQAYPEAYDVIQYTILGLASTLLMYLIWPPALREQKVLAWAWPGVVFYALFLVGGCLVLMNGFDQNHLFLFMLNLVMAMLFFPWFVVLGMMAGTVALNGLFFVFYMEGYMLLGNQSNTYFIVIYGLLLASSLLMALFKHRQSYEELKTYNRTLSRAHATTQAALLDSFKEKIGMLRTLKRAGIESLPKLAKQAQALHVQGQAPLAQHPDLLKAAEELEKQLVPMAMSLDRIESRVMDYLQLQVHKMPLRPLIEEVKRVLHMQNLHQEIHFHIKTEHGILTCDPQRIVTLLVNSVVMLRNKVGPEPPIQVAVHTAKLFYTLKSVKKNYEKQVPALRFIVTTLSPVPEEGPLYAGQVHKEPLPMADTPEALLPITNQRIVRAHYGYAAQEDALYKYVIPVDVRSLRTPDMDRAYMNISAELMRADDHFKSDKVDAQAQEKAFLQAVQAHTKADLKQIRTALEMIKWYHGSVKRKTGEPFYLHPVAVAQIVLDYNQDEATVLGALLHDTVEDTPMLIENIETAFGTEVMGIVAGVTHLESYGDSFQKVKMSPDENIMMLLGLADERALYVKIADRLHNMRTIHGQGHEKQVIIAQETIRFYVPLAEKLGLHKAVEELKERCFKVLSEQGAKAIKRS